MTPSTASPTPPSAPPSSSASALQTRLHALQSRRSAISSFLTRHSLREWATRYRIINGRPFHVAPALQEVYDSTDRYVVVRKAAQVGISEWLLNNALWI